MSAFIIQDKTKYLVTSPKCLGMPCLNLGNRVCKIHPLNFSLKSSITLCCTNMVDKGCPANIEVDYEIKKENIQQGMSVRLI